MTVLRTKMPEAIPPRKQPTSYPSLSELAPTKEDWARECEQQADELGEYINNFPMTVPEKSELIELQARLRLRANELRSVS